MNVDEKSKVYLYHLVLVIYLDPIHKTCHISMSVHV